VAQEAKVQPQLNRFNIEVVMGEDLDTYEKVCDSRFSRIEAKLDSIESKLDNRLKPLEEFQNKALGIILLISFAVPFVMELIKR
jgi:hypothetical protein